MQANSHVNFSGLADGRSSSSYTGNDCHQLPVETDERSYRLDFKSEYTPSLEASVKGAAKTSDCFISTPVISDDRSSSIIHGISNSSDHDFENRGIPTYCPSGSNSLMFMDGNSLLEKILTFCKPVTVCDKVITNITQMLATKWPEVSDDLSAQFPQFAQLYQRVKSHNLPNCIGAKIPIQSGLHVERWVVMLQNYHDNEICHFLAY